MGALLWPLIIILFVLFVAAFAGAAGIGGISFSVEAAMPKWSKMNPLKWLKANGRGTKLGRAT